LGKQDEGEKKRKENVISNSLFSVMPHERGGKGEKRGKKKGEGKRSQSSLPSLST